MKVKDYFLKAEKILRDWKGDSYAFGQNVFDQTGKFAQPYGKKASFIVTELGQPWIEKTDLSPHGTEARIELKVPKDPSRYLELQITSLHDRGQLLNGRLLVFRDITERKLVESDYVMSTTAYRGN